MENLFISGLQAPNAYPYFDNRNTPFNDTDDQWKTRVNNDVQTLQGLATWTMNGLDVFHAELYREQGIPGHITIPTPDIRLDSRRRLTGIHSAESTENWSHDSVAWWSTQSETLADPLAIWVRAHSNKRGHFKRLVGEAPIVGLVMKHCFPVWVSDFVETMPRPIVPQNTLDMQDRDRLAVNSS